MSTNPFDDGPSSASFNPRSSRAGAGPRSSQGWQQQRNASSASGRRLRLGSSQQEQRQQRQQRQRQQVEGTTTAGSGGSDPIWAARGVEWPIPPQLSAGAYSRLARASRLAGSVLGIAPPAGDGTGGGGGAAGADGTSGGGGDGGGGRGSKKGSLGSEVRGEGGDDVLPSATKTGGGNSYIAGLMGKVWTGSSGADGGMAATDYDDPTSPSRPIRSPAARCVAAANGWIIAVVDCPPLTSSSLVPPLRLVSRWNVRRGTTTSTSSSVSSADLLIPLPPSVCVGPDRASFSASVSTSAIAHVFVDPTGCHALLSARNGEAYYLHSASQRPRKLSGFGPNPDGTSSCKNGKAGSTSDESGQHQLGLTIGSYVTAVGWDRLRGTEGSTKKILLGTSIGEIYEYSLVSPTLDASDNGADNHADADLLPTLLHRFDAVDDAAQRSGSTYDTVVSGIHFECPKRVENSLLGGGSTYLDGALVLVVTSGAGKRTRLHTFRASSETSSSSSVSSSLTFASTFSNAEERRSSFVELPGSIKFADLRICGESFSLKTEAGLYYGTIGFASSGLVARNMPAGGTVDSGLLLYDDIPAKGAASIPTSVALTPNHFILLGDSNEICFINRVSKMPVQKERVDWMSLAKTSGDDHVMSGVAELLMDSRRPDQVWLRKSRSLVHVSSSCEARDVWMYTLQHCLLDGSTFRSGTSSSQSDVKFERANSLCSNNLQKAIVKIARAEFYLSLGRVELSSKYMAQCPPTLMPFDRTAVHLASHTLGLALPDERFFSLQAQEALGFSNLGLLTYLADKMRLAKIKDDEVACSMIGAWLVELHLSERSKRFDRHGTIMKKHHKLQSPTSSVILDQFLSSNATNIDPNTTMSIVASHDVDAAECSGYAASSCDVGTAVDAALFSCSGKGGALDAIRILNESTFEQAEPYYYKFAFTILGRAPMAAAKSFLAKYAEGLNPSKLLPSFLHYDRRRKDAKKMKDASDSFLVDDENASVEYFEGVIRLGCQRTAVYNYLILLYSSMEDEVPLHRFLSTHIPTYQQRQGRAHFGSFGRPKLSSPLDMSYALRVILKTGRHFRSAVKLYMGFGMRQQAVELAIKVDPTLARELARESTDPEERKCLWLMIARNAAAGGNVDENVVASVASVLNDCGPEILSIEDVLPFLPDFAEIDQIQDDICSALTAYSSKIERLVKEMGECENTCQGLREEIYRLGASSMKVMSDAECAVTHRPISRERDNFYVFPSGHVFSQHSLMELVEPYLNEKQLSRLKYVTSNIMRLQNKNGPSSIADLSEHEKYSLEKLQSELDGLIAAECPLTGAIMVDSINRGFPGDDEV